jgi:hypothetical protein
MKGASYDCTFQAWRQASWPNRGVGQFWPRCDSENVAWTPDRSGSVHAHGIVRTERRPEGRRCGRGRPRHKS